MLRSGFQVVPQAVGGNPDSGCDELRAQIAGNQRTVTETIRVISSPWKETP